MEIKAKLCKNCNTVKPAHWDGAYHNDAKTKIYTNANNQQWNGKICPECHVIITREKMKKLREGRRSIV